MKSSINFSDRGNNIFSHKNASKLFETILGYKLINRHNLQDIEYFANYRRKLGIDVTTVRYDESLHVKHLAENRESYVKAVYNFINKCLNGSN